jgi:hypothetical protein
MRLQARPPCRQDARTQADQTLPDLTRTQTVPLGDTTMVRRCKSALKVLSGAAGRLRP